MNSTRIVCMMAVVLAALGGCASYPPAVSPAKGQNAGQQDFDARDCDRQVHSGIAWSEKERDDYVGCMQVRGYTPAPK